MPSRSTPSRNRTPAARALLIWLSLLVSAGAPRPAAGQKPAPAPESARTHYARGEALFQQGHYAEAHDEFASGYRLSGRPLFIMNMAHARRRQGALGQAEALYRRYLLVAPDSPLRWQVESVLEEIELVNAAERYPGPSSEGVQPAEPMAPFRSVPSVDAGPVELTTAPVTRAPVIRVDPLERWPRFDGNRSALGPRAGLGNQEPPARVQGSAAPRPKRERETPAAPSRLFGRPWFWVLAGSLVAGAAGVGWAVLLEQPRRDGTLGMLGAPR
jgi:hypothetical protein